MSQDSYNFSTQLDEIFSVIEKHSIIHIDYQAFPCAVDDEYVVDFRLRSLNGFQSIGEFHSVTSEVASGFLDDLSNNFRSVPRKFRTKFGEDILDRFSDLMSLVTYERSGRSFRPLDEEPEPGCFLFTQANFFGDNYHESAIYIDQILYAASDYAWAWWDVMSDLLEKVRILVTTIQLLPEIHVSEHDEASFEKIRMRLTVPQLACLFKLLVKGNLIDVTNKSQLVRSLSEVFQTKGQDYLSWRNFKNHFDSPSPDAIEFCRQEFLNLSQMASRFLDDANE